jgi:hypothetical protein
MSTLPRFTGLPNEDNTGGRETHDFQATGVAQGATLAITATKAKTLVDVILSVALSVTAVLPTAAADDNTPLVGDEIDILFSNPTGGTLVVTFGSGFATPGTLSVPAAKFARATFRFNGTVFVGSSFATA